MWEIIRNTDCFQDTGPWHGLRCPATTVESKKNFDCCHFVKHQRRSLMAQSCDDVITAALWLLKRQTFQPQGDFLLPPPPRLQKQQSASATFTAGRQRPRLNYGCTCSSQSSHDYHVILRPNEATEASIRWDSCLSVCVWCDTPVPISNVSPISGYAVYNAGTGPRCLCASVPNKHTHAHA